MSERHGHETFVESSATSFDKETQREPQEELSPDIALLLPEEEEIGRLTPERVLFDRATRNKHLFTKSEGQRLLHTIRNARRARLVLEQKPTQELHTALTTAERDVRECELRLDEQEAWQATRAFLQAPPAQIYEALKNGTPHPRFNQMPILEMLDKLPEQKPIRKEDVLARALPESVGPLYRFFRSPAQKTGVAIVDMQIDTAMNQIENHFFTEAAETLMRVFEQVPTFWRNEINQLANSCRAESVVERERYETLNALQKELYETVQKNHPERADRIKQREETEDVLRQGTLVGELKAAFEMVVKDGLEVNLKSGASRPLIGTFEFEINKEKRRIEALVKLELADPFVRRGATPGSGPMREVIGAMHSVAFGSDNVPAVVTRELPGLGRVSVHELVDAKSCEHPDERDRWYKREDEAFDEQIRLAAIEDFLLLRTDGAPRNLLTDGARLWRIDFGTDFPHAAPEGMYSAPLFVRQRSDIPKSTRTLLQNYENSKELKLFEQAALLLPEENMYLALEHYEERLKHLLQSSAIPSYDQRWIRNFNNTRLEAYGLQQMQS